LLNAMYARCGCNVPCVACHFPPEQLADALAAFGDRVAASCEIFANAAGGRPHVRVESFESLPGEDELPGIEDIIGMLGDK
jgi:hypothetical protein